MHVLNCHVLKNVVFSYFVFFMFEIPCTQFMLEKDGPDLKSTSVIVIINYTENYVFYLQPLIAVRNQEEMVQKDLGHVSFIIRRGRDGSGPGESGYSSKPAPFGPGMDYTYWTMDGYGDTRINPRGDGGGDGLTLTPAPYPPHPRYPLNK